MSATHTPGPWIVQRNGPTAVTFRIWRNDHCGELSPEGGNEGYACISRHVRGEANARLIAAAPDLLAACERIVKGECTCADGGKGFMCDVCEAKAAIAKAKGTK